MQCLNSFLLYNVQATTKPTCSPENDSKVMLAVESIRQHNGGLSLLFKDRQNIGKNLLWKNIAWLPNESDVYDDAAENTMEQDHLQTTNMKGASEDLGVQLGS